MLRVSRIAFLAIAYGVMIGHFAFCIRTAVAGSDTKLIYARFGSWTIWVRSAAYCHGFRCWSKKWQYKFYKIFTNVLINEKLIIFNLRGWHWTRGSPVYPVGHLHTGAWFSTWQKAPLLHGSPTTHGLTQSSFTQPLSLGQSSSLEHSGSGGKTGILETANWNGWLELSFV